MKKKRSNDGQGVIWVVGLSGSGKTTLINALRRKLMLGGPNVLSLDGDRIRKCLSNTKDYSKENRIKQFRKMQQLAKEFQEQGLIVLVATLYFNQSVLDENRKLFDNYLEVYTKAPLEKLIEEDEKSLYRNCLSGNITDVVGMDIEWIPPHHPDITTSRFEADPDSLADAVLAKIEFLE